MRPLFLLLVCSLIVSCGQTEDTSNETNDTGSLVDTSNNGIVEYSLNETRLNAVDYNNELSLIQQSVYDQIGILFLSSPEMVDQNLDNTLFELELKANDLERIEALDGGEAFKGAIQELIAYYKKELGGSFSEVLPILRIAEEERTDAETYRLNDYDEQFAIGEQPILERIATEQEKFAIANNFKIEG